jgi:hypothetical protein|nr:MAG TPA: hypothetical protein [Caudoviricetes sp.]
MIKEALQYIVGLSEARIHNVTLPDGTIQTYSDKSLNLLKKDIPKADYITMNTLTSLIDYIKGGIDTMADKMIIEVESPTEVTLYSPLDDNRKREYLVNVKALLPNFDFGTFMNQEKFCINLQSKFLDERDRALILKFAGTVEAGTVAEYGDDGITQKATIKTGIASKSDAVVPNPVRLTPYRTFLEVDQPASNFVFRIKQDKYEGVACALFEADGGAWKIEAKNNIKEYLQRELAEYTQFVVIS